MLECALCRNAVDQLVDSHVIPRALHADAKGDNPFLLIVRQEAKWSQRSMTGVYGQFVCENCERIFNDWDTHGVEVLKALPTAPDERGQLAFTMASEDFNYSLLKLFALSMLWHAHMAKHELFGIINLTEEQEASLRESLLRGQAGDRDFFATTLTRFVDEEARHILMNPLARNMEKLNTSVSTFTADFRLR